MVRALRYGAAILGWMPIGHLKFRIAYVHAAKRGQVCLQVGSGRVRLNGWLNTDIVPLSPLFLDAIHRFPIGDNSVSLILGEHFIEHVPRSSALVFFKESFRVLKPHGLLRISTPDAESLAKAYLNNSEDVSLLNERNRLRGSQYTTYPIDILNTAFEEHGHLCLYDAQVLEQLLSSVGFENITRCKVGESRHIALRGMEQHDVGSIADNYTCVIEAAKPLH